MGVDEKCGSLDVARAIEHEHRAVSAPLGLDDPQPKLAPALLSLLVAQDHGQVRREVPVALLAFAGFGSDPEPGFPGTLGGSADRRFNRSCKETEKDPGPHDPGIEQ